MNIEIAILAAIFLLGTTVAKSCGRKGPVFGGAAILAYFGGAAFGPVLIEAVIGRPLEESDREPLLWNIFADEFMSAELICALTHPPSSLRYPWCFQGEDLTQVSDRAVGSHTA